MKVGDLKAAAYNPRKISEAQLAALRQAMEVFGDLGGIVFNRKTGNLVGGHQRVKTLDPSWPIRSAPIPMDKTGTVARGHIETPFGDISYREVEWEERVERAANIAANRHGGSWDDAKLREVLVGLDDGSGILELTGFNQEDLSGLLGREPAPELPSDKDKLFEQITFTVTKAQLATIGFALDAAKKSAPFEGTGNENARGNALARVCEAYGRGR